MSQARRTILALLFFLLISPERISNPNSCALHKFLMVGNILIIFSGGVYKDQ